MPEVPFGGDLFAVAEKIAAIPLMRFADAAVRGVDSDSVEGLATMYQLLRSCLAEHEWERFQEVATRTCAGHEDLWALIQEVLAGVSERPTERPSDSSDGPALTPVRSAEGSSSRAIGRLEGQGRPDLALQVLKTQEYQAS